MKHVPWIAIAAAALGIADAAEVARDYPVKPVPFTAVHFTDAFWLPRIETNRTVSIPFAFEKCEETKRIEHFERAAAALRGEELKDKKPPGYPFDDTDVYKVIEGAAYALSVRPDPKLEAYLDGLIAKIAAAQEGDGYLYTTRTIDPQNPHRWAGKERWELEKVDSHELYNLGHLYEAAAAHYQATGKRTLLDVALKTAELLDRTFGPGKRSIWPGHQITEMGLVKLYRVTGDVRYLNLAKFLLDVRGPDGSEGAGRKYNQSHVRVVDQDQAVGHAVRATYMYSGMADVAALTGDAAYVTALDRIWDDVVGRKLYVTGGIGATGSGEAFGLAYELPNMSAYNETCAAIGNDYWNHRLFLLHADARYVDVMERILYNGLLSGVSLDGRSFFYPNPLESAGQHQRSPWFGVACCPGNMTRFLASLPGYVYAQRGDTLYVNLFVASTADVKMDGGRTVKVVQETRYPWDGAVRITVAPGRSRRFAMNVRVPGWARGESVPSDLYRFADTEGAPVTIKVNGQAVPIALDKGYVRIQRQWKAGDTVELSLPMPVRRVIAHSSVEADRDRVALQRGPIVFAAEWPDNASGHVRNLLLSDDARLTTEFRADLLGGVEVVKGRAVALADNERGEVDRREQDFVAIPYYAWANRGPGEMAVWIPNRATSARPQPLPTLASKARVTSSAGGRNPRAVNDQNEPRSSRDGSSSFLHWWPRKGSTEWVEYQLAVASAVSAVEVYWLDDTGTGECRVPASWRVLYKEDGDWKPVEATGPYGVLKDAYNTVAFKPVTTSGLRLEVTLQAQWSAGIQEWKVGAATAPRASGPAATASSELRDVVDRFETDRAALLRRYPVERSPQRVARLKAFYQDWRSQVGALDFERLGLEGRIDSLLLRNEVESEARLLGRHERQLYETAPGVPFASVILGLNDARLGMEAMDAARAASVLDALAGQIESTGKRVEADPSHAATPLVAFRAQEATDDLKKVLESWYQFYAGYDPLFTWWAAAPYKKVTRALDDYRKLLREKVLGIRPGEDDPIVGTPIGRDALVADLASELIPYSPEDLLAIADREFAWCEAEMKKAARDMGLGEDWKAAVEKVKTLHVEPGKQPDLIRDLAREAEAYLEQHGLISVPPLAKEVWRMQMMTPERQKVNPFFTGGEVISVSFPTDSMEHADKLMSLRGNNVHFARATVFHELIPGHHLQAFMNARHNSHRRAFRTPFWGEGWALYWEMLLWDRGFQKSPENRIGMLFWRMHRAARIIFSLRFHLGTMTPQECTDFLVDRVGHERANAAAEVRRSFNGSYPPLYQLAYMMGGLQFKALHRELVESGRMSDREFHDAVMTGGPMPVELVRARLTGQTLPRDHTTSWKFAGDAPAGKR